MDSKVLLSVLALAAAATLSAKQITADEALMRLNSSNGIPSAAKARIGHPLVIAQTINTPDNNSPALYIFRQDEQLLVLPADDQVKPLLGYTDTPAEGQMPEQLQWWLNEYARQIQYLRSNSATGLYISNNDTTNSSEAAAHAESTTTRTAIAPKITTRWNQGDPFNRQCPLIDSSRAMTGCVATATSQLMKYYNYPEVGIGSISYTDGYGNSYEMDFSAQAFDWANMIDRYESFTDDQANAVAYLMKAVGHATKMNYSSYSSGANSSVMAAGLKTYFGYNDNLQILYRSYFNLSDWENMIYNHLANVGPLFYAGDDTESGHAFVCDGYSDNGYFHFNWGWGGAYDGYFQLTALLPEGQGIGGNAGGYNFGQEAIFNIVPPGYNTLALPAICPLALNGSLIGYVDTSDSTPALVFSTDGYSESSPVIFSNTTSEDVACTLYLILTNTATGQSNTYTIYSGTFKPNYGIGSFSLPFSMPAGTYKVSLATKIGTDTNLQSLAHEVSCTDYFYATYDNNNQLSSVTNIGTIQPEITDLKVITDLYLGSNFQFSFTAENPADTELYTGVYPAIFTVTESSTESAQSTDANKAAARTATTTLIAKGDAISLTLPVNQSEQLTMTSSMTTYSSTFTGGEAFFGLVSTDSGQVLAYIPVTVNEAADETKISQESFTFNGDASNADTSNLSFNCKIQCTQGVYYEPIHVYIINSEFTAVRAILKSTETFFLNTGDTAEATVAGSYSDAVVGETYYACIGSVNSSNQIVVCSPYITLVAGEPSAAGIALNRADSNDVAVVADRFSGFISVNAPIDIAKIEAYSIDGRAIAIESNINAASATIPMNSMPNGINILRITLTDGSCVARKVIN